MKLIYNTFFTLLLTFIISGCSTYKMPEYKQESRRYNNYEQNFSIKVPEGYKLILPNKDDLGLMTFEENSYYNYNSSQMEKEEVHVRILESPTHLIDQKNKIHIKLQPKCFLTVTEEEAHTILKKRSNKEKGVKELYNCYYSEGVYQNVYRVKGATAKSDTIPVGKTVYFTFNVECPAEQKAKARRDFAELLKEFKMPFCVESDRYIEEKN